MIFPIISIVYILKSYSKRKSRVAKTNLVYWPQNNDFLSLGVSLQRINLWQLKYIRKMHLLPTLVLVSGPDLHFYFFDFDFFEIRFFFYFTFSPHTYIDAYAHTHPRAHTHTHTFTILNFSSLSRVGSKCIFMIYFSCQRLIRWRDTPSDRKSLFWGQ